jgi:hypothetical protein
MSNPIAKVDEFFYTLIPDEGPRVFCLHLPFWGGLLCIVWNLAEHFGLYLIWAAVVFVIFPYGLASFGHGIYERNKFERLGSLVTLFRFIVVSYVVAVYLIIGIPGFRNGYLIRALASETFATWYVQGLVVWYRVFNFYHDIDPKEFKKFIYRFELNYQTWQWCLLVSLLVIVPGMFYLIYSIAKDEAKKQELAKIKALEEVAERRERDEARRKECAERELAYEKEKKREQEIEQEKQRKIKAKITEVKGKDPWSSGFL